MKKSFFLFLLLLLSVIGSVNAQTVYLEATSGHWTGSNTTVTYAGIGDIPITVISDDTISIEISGIMDLFAPIGATTSTDPTMLHTLLIEDVLTQVEYMDSSEITRNAVLDDVKVKYSGTSDVAYVVEMYQKTYNGQDYTVTVNSCSGYTTGWRNNRGTVLINDVVSSEYFYPFYASPVGINDNTTIATSTGDTGGTGYTAIDIVVVSFDEPLSITGQFSSANIERTIPLYPITYPVTFSLNTDGISVYESDGLLGVVNNGDTINLPAGVHSLTFVKDGYYNTTQSVLIETSPVGVSVDLVTSELPISLGLTDSEGGLTGVTLYLDGELFGTVGNNQDVILPKGTHELIFEKTGYWNETRTVTVDETLTDLSIRMYLDTVMYSVNMPTDLNTYKNSALPIALTINPNAYSQSTKLFISGKDILDVRNSANEQLTKVDGGYVLGDITSAQDVIVTIDSGDVLGTNTVQIRVTGYGTLGESYVTDASVTYDVLQLPISIVVPSKWNIGSNILRVSETEGLQRVVMIQIDDEDGNLVYSDSYAFEGYESHSFEISFSETGNYKLKIVSGDSINSYLWVEVVNPITFLETTVSGTEGISSSVILNVQNLFSEPQYYKVTVSGDALSNISITEFSVSPGLTKNQEISIPVGTNLEFDSYSLVAKVYLKNSDGVYEEIKNQVLVLNIEESSDNFISALIPTSFSLGGLDPSTIIDAMKNNPVLIAIIGICVLLGGSTLIPGGRKK
ncbi:hypothetical protein HNP89_000583 [Methanococcus maripaludis]|uniref:PEGA domain-containing protein n=1 Tax=Methanococcus maripaludis TaxID=39152 RepID=A0A7J9P3K6_METMI|nr:hypothetical protein [Methanococcus maripaludis]MBA2852646.1 hypothetical protein [Methanococcus maripaludis]